MIKEILQERRLRKEMCETGRLMYQRGFVAANDGNISAKISEGRYLFTPSNVSKGAMKPTMLVVMDGTGKVLKGRRVPSSEYRMHLRVYRENPEIGAVVHAHPPVATSYAIAGEPLDAALLTEAVVLLGVVPVAPYALPGTDGVPDSVAPFCKTNNAVLLENHGALTWGRDLKEAYFRMEAVENFAGITMRSKILFGHKGLLDESEVASLLRIRKTLGIKAGGTPVSGVAL